MMKREGFPPSRRPVGRQQNRRRVLSHYVEMLARQGINAHVHRTMNFPAYLDSPVYPIFPLLPVLLVLLQHGPGRE